VLTKAAPGAAAVELEWSAVSPPGVGSVEYYVTAEGGTPGTGCPTAAAPSASRSCTESGVSLGSHQYTVTAVWRSWTSVSATRTATVTFGAATHLVLETAHAELSAGESDALTILAKDAAGNTVLTYSGAHSLTFAGAAAAASGTRPTVSSQSGTAVGLGEATAIDFTEGRASISGAANGQLVLYAAEEAHIKVTEGSLSNEGALAAVKVKPAAFKSFHAVATPAEPEAGASFEVKLTAWDEWHNPITTYARAAGKKLVWSGAAASPSGQAPAYTPTTEPTFAAGEVTLTAFKLYNAGSTTLKVSEEGTGNSGEVTVAVRGAGAAGARHWAWSHAEVTAGTISSLTCLFTCETSNIGGLFARFKAHIMVTDEWGNPVTGLSGTNHAEVTMSSGFGIQTNANGIVIPTTGIAESTTVYEFESLLLPGEAKLHVTTEAGLALTEATATVVY
jgi:hypothetical protein